MHEDEANVGKSPQSPRDDEARCRSHGFKREFEYRRRRHRREGVGGIIWVDECDRFAQVELLEQRREVLITQIFAAIARENDEAVHLQGVEAVRDLVHARIDVGESLTSPGDKAVGPHQDAASIRDTADLRPFPLEIVEVLPQPNSSRLDLDAELGRNGFRSLDPGLAADNGQQREARIVGHIKRRDLLSVVLHPDVRKMRPGDRVRLEVEFPILLEFREGHGGSNNAAAIALPQFDAVSIELIVHKLESGEKCPSPLLTPIRIAKELVQVGAGVVFTHPGPKASRLGPRLDLVMAFHRSIDQLAPYGLALLAVAVEEAVPAGSGTRSHGLPCGIALIRGCDRATSSGMSYFKDRTAAARFHGRSYFDRTR